MRIKTILIWSLWLIALHSIGFGLALIIFPCSVLEFFGFTISQKFFAAQGGVFHLIISFVYIRAAMDPEHSKDLVILACITKFSATVFLFAYYIFGTPLIVIFFSGFMDFIMGLAILIFYLLFRKSSGVILE
ncbi:MAG: hypothetical protein IH596_08340 [Bacteroidales bacterium]|nr:hypothetical protein [Bacteroidales bacterium]